MKLDDLISRLDNMKGSGGWQRLAEVSGVNYFTIARIYRREIKNPGQLTCERIEAGLAQLGTGREPVYTTSDSKAEG